MGKLFLILFAILVMSVGVVQAQGHPHSILSCIYECKPQQTATFAPVNSWREVTSFVLVNHELGHELG